jgi:hypothetical protein
LPNEPATIAPAFARWRWAALAHRHTAAERDRGLTLLAEVSDVFARHAHNLGDRPLVEVYVAREMAWRGDLDEAIPLMCAATDHLVREGQLLGGALQRRVFWPKHCSTAAPTVTSPKPRPPSSG